jgi:hypothetical protein
MRINVRKTVELGDLVVAAFDVAALYSSNSRQVSHLATQTVMHVLGRARGTPAPRIVFSGLRQMLQEPRNGEVLAVWEGEGGSVLELSSRIKEPNLANAKEIQLEASAWGMHGDTGTSV